MKLLDLRSPFIGPGENTGDWRTLLGPIKWVGINWSGCPTDPRGWELNFRCGHLSVRVGTTQQAIWWRHYIGLCYFTRRAEPFTFGYRNRLTIRLPRPWPNTPPPVAPSA